MALRVCWDAREALKSRDSAHKMSICTGHHNLPSKLRKSLTFLFSFFPNRNDGSIYLIELSYELPKIAM